MKLKKNLLSLKMQSLHCVQFMNQQSQKQLEEKTQDGSSMTSFSIDDIQRKYEKNKIQMGKVFHHDTMPIIQQKSPDRFKPKRSLIDVEPKTTFSKGFKSIRETHSSFRCDCSNLFCGIFTNKKPSEGQNPIKNIENDFRDLKHMEVEDLDMESFDKYPLVSMVVVAAMMEVITKEGQLSQTFVKIKGAIIGDQTVLTCRHLFWKLEEREIKINMSTVRVIPFKKFIEDDVTNKSAKDQKSYLLDCQLKPVKYCPEVGPKLIEKFDPKGRANLEDYLYITVSPTHHLEDKYGSLVMDFDKMSYKQGQILPSCHLFSFLRGRLLHFKGNALIFGETAVYKLSKNVNDKFSGDMLTIEQENGHHVIVSVHQGKFGPRGGEQIKIADCGLILAHRVFKNLQQNFRYDRHTYNLSNEKLQWSDMAELTKKIGDNEKFLRREARIVLILAFNDLLSEGCFYLYQGIEEIGISNRLMVLDFAECKIGDLGCKHLSNLKLSILAKIDLTSNFIRPKGVTSVVKMLEKAVELREVVIAKNNIQNQGLAILAQGPWRKLRLLDATKNGLTSIQCILSSNWEKLKKLRLGRNQLSPKSLTCLVGSKWKLQLLDVEDTLLTQEEERDLFGKLNLKFKEQQSQGKKGSLGGFSKTIPGGDVEDEREKIQQQFARTLEDSF